MGMILEIRWKVILAIIGRFLAGAYVLAISAQLACAAPPSSCEDLVPSIPTEGGKRDIDTSDLVRLRDIGRPDSSAIGTSPLGISPDGQKVAFVMRRADPEANSYCQGLFIMDVRGSARPRLIDQGGELITTELQDLRGLVFPTGLVEVVVPRWSPDGRTIAYLKRLDGVTQIWLVQADGSGARALTRSRDDIDAVAWTDDGSGLVFATRPALGDARREIQRKASEGYVYDDQLWPLAGSRPFPRGPVPRAYSVILTATNEIRTATPVEAALIDPGMDSRRPTGAVLTAISAKGGYAWTALESPGQFPSPAGLWAATARGAKAECDHPACKDDIIGLWWSQDDRTVVFLHQEGWGKSEFGLYRWQPGKGAPRRILKTEEVLAGCQSTGTALICLRDAATEPRRLVAIDLLSGRTRVLFDPNPEFTAIRFGRVERLHWRNDGGLECYGDLVLPLGYDPSRRYPLIVVQYRTKGFLRGGTGDEYPIHPLAARGYAVLSFERPPVFALTLVKSWNRWQEAEPENVRNWADRRSVQSALETGVRLLIERGIADPRRIGVTGVSDGAAAAWFSLINSNLFAAAAISSCCQDHKTQMPLAGEAWRKELRSFGFPPSIRDDPDFWRPFSLALNADRVKTPILMQLSDDSYLLGLEAITALKEYGRPAEMIVFPGERHVKWQPAHRLAIYNRSIDWFDFWLLDREDSAPGKQDQYRRWRALRQLDVR